MSQSEKPEGPISNVRNSLVGKLGDQLALRYTRRSLIYRLGAAAAGILGVKFIPPFVADTWVRMAEAQETPPDGEKEKKPKKPKKPKKGDPLECEHDQPCTTKTSEKCGFANPQDCTAYNSAACPGCWDGMCPRPLKRGGSWEVCCTCLADPFRGETFKYVDCCGSDINRTPPGDCTPCEAAAKAAGCPPTLVGRNPANCPPQNWCAPQPGEPICTVAINTGTACTPS